jgi:hypothetical protein
MYAMICSYHNLLYAMSLVSRYMDNPGKEYWKVVQWIFGYLLHIFKACLKFDRKGKGLIGYVNSYFSPNLDNRMSLKGYMFTVFDCDVS